MDAFSVCYTERLFLFTSCIRERIYQGSKCNQEDSQVQQFVPSNHTYHLQSCVLEAFSPSVKIFSEGKHYNSFTSDYTKMADE